MKFSEKWLRQWANLELSTDELAAQLTMLGLEVDSVEPAAGEFSGVVIGHVVEREKHPDADRLSVCQVDVGEKAPLQIVCGAANVRQGLKVAVSVVGAVLPGDFKIKRSKLRGVESEGMICSEKELGLAESSDGIMELPDDAPIGKAFFDYYELDDHIIDIELTPNRGDCASIQGIARDLVAAASAKGKKIKIHEPDAKPVKAKIKDAVNIVLQDPKSCPRYVARVIKGVQTDVQTPLWLQECLRRSGVRCIHPVVDVCNYVMLELGQPMHAFDLAKLQGDIQVRQAEQQEKIILLDEQELTLTCGGLVIADDNGPQALAGIMGGLHSGVSAGTTDLLLESAFFEATQTSLTCRAYKLGSDSSYRFERGIDHALQKRAIERATQLIVDMLGGEPGPVVEVSDQYHLPEAVLLKLHEASVERLLGIAIDSKEIETILTALGFSLKRHKTGWQVSVPSWRPDVSLEADLIEEIARVFGYDQIPARDLHAALTMPHLPEHYLSRSRVADALVDRGYHEAITYSFVEPKLQTMVHPDAKAICLLNPIAADLSVMRASLWPGLLRACLHNQNRQVQRQRLFETGLHFVDRGGEWHQSQRLAMLITGDRYPEQWGEVSTPCDFFDLKGDVQALLDLTHQADCFNWKAGSQSALHPGQRADLYKGDDCVGHLGALHPSIAQTLGFNQPVFLFEMELQALLTAAVPNFKPISKFPAMRRDIALEVDESVSADELIAIVRQNGGALLCSVEVFDVYQGERVENGKKSIALSLTFQDPSRTLEAEEIDRAGHNLLNQINLKLEK